MSSRHSQLNHRLYETVKRELGPEYIRLFAPHLFSHGVPAGVTGMILSAVAAMYMLYFFLYVVGLLDYVDIVEHYFFILIPIVVFMIFSYTFPFQDMVMGKKNRLSYFKKYGFACTAMSVPGVFILEPAIPAGILLDKAFLALPVLVGSAFCLLIYSKKFATMLAYQQKLWVIKHRLIEEDKALVAELTRSTRKK